MELIPKKVEKLSENMKYVPKTIEICSKRGYNEDNLDAKARMERFLWKIL